MKMKIAVDVDGVLASTQKSMLTHLNAKHGRELKKLGLKPFTLSDITSYDFDTPKFRKIGFCGSDDVFDLTDFVWHNNWKIIKTVEQNMKKRLEALGRLADVDIVTGNINPEVEYWLDMHRFPYKKLIRSHSKWDLDYAFFIDDDPNIANKLPEQKTQFLYDQPWNRGAAGGKNIRRIKSFEQAIAELIKK